MGGQESGGRSGDEELLELVAEALRPAPPSREDVVTAGRAAWAWRGITRDVLVVDEQALCCTEAPELPQPVATPRAGRRTGAPTRRVRHCPRRPVTRRPET